MQCLLSTMFGRQPMKMKFKGRYNYGKCQILADSEEATALFNLLRRSYIEADELPWIGKMGFDIEIRGDVREIAGYMKKRDSEFEIDENRNIFIKNGCPKCEAREKEKLDHP